MNKKKKKIIRYSIILGVIVLAALIALIAYGNREVEAVRFEVENTDRMAFNKFLSTESRLDNSLLEYGKVLTKYDQKGYTDYTGSAINVDLKAITGTDGGGALKRLTEADVYDASAGGIKWDDRKSGTEQTVDCSAYPDAFYCSADSTKITFEVSVTESGLYSLSVDYLMVKAKDAEMYVGLYIDNKLPFKNAVNMALTRQYNFYNTEVEKNLDIQGNQIRPKTQEMFSWQSTVMSNPEGFYRNPYKFYLKAGTHKITMEFYNQPGIIGSISFVAPLKTVSYDEYVNSNGGINGTYSGKPIQFELENPEFTSSVSVRMEYDNDYASSPASYKTTRYNVFGGERWSEGGDSVEWKFNVEQDGWYQLGFRYMSIYTFVSAYKEIKIDGVIPFTEMEEYSFPYADKWTGDCLKNTNDDPYLFYLTAGEHTLTLTNKIGPLRHTYQALEEAMDAITNLINQVAKITSSARSSSGGFVVDKNRDWDLEKNIPDLQDDLNAYLGLFDDAYNQILEVNGGKLPSYGSAVKVAYELFKDLADDMEEVPVSLNDINSALTGLSNTLVAIREQAITVDYMVLSDKGYDYKNAESNSWQSIYVGFVRFFDTFTKDYSSVGQREEMSGDLPSIEVYISRGREYVDILRNLVSEQFTPDYGVKVNVNMVNGSEGLIMTRYVAGTAPDLAVAIGAGIPFEFAVRGALLPLDKEFNETYTLDNGTQVLGFDDLVAQSFYAEELIPFLYQGHYYAFPETQGWAALFYRTDILAELDLSAPDTWEDVYDMVPVLTKEGYSFYYPYGVGNYAQFLYQHGGEYYDADGLVSALNSNAAYDAFIEYANLYLQYNFIYAADFYMRFKSGEMPVGIADMGFYCKLKYSAPELNGKWTILPIPGHAVSVDGQTVVDRSTGGVGSCNIVISSTKHPKEAWQFIQWWSSDKVQQEYGREVEATFGVASRWNPANKNAVQSLPYTQYELSVIYDQWEWLKESPNVLGGYYTSRFLVTALNQTVLQGMNARVSLEDAIKEINKEMKRKQKEYRIPENGSVLRDVSNNA